MTKFFLVECLHESRKHVEMKVRAVLKKKGGFLDSGFASLFDKKVKCGRPQSTSHRYYEITKIYLYFKGIILLEAMEGRDYEEDAIVAGAEEVKASEEEEEGERMLELIASPFDYPAVRTRLEEMGYKYWFFFV